MDLLNEKGWKLTAKLLNKYKGKVDDMFKKILQKEAKELMELIANIRDDIIKIIKGGHITPQGLNDEEMLSNPFDDCKSKIERLMD